MNKQEFLTALQNGLVGLPSDDITRWVDFYSEMLDDRIEDGLTELEAVEEIGTVEEVTSQILAETSLPKLLIAKVKPKKSLKTWETALLILGSPIWVPLLAAGGVIVLAMYIVVWSCIISLYAVDLSFAVAAVAGIVGGVAYLTVGNVGAGLFLIGAGLFSAGVSILLLFAFNKITKWILIFSNKALLSIKAKFITKGDKLDEKI